MVNKMEHSVTAYNLHAYNLNLFKMPKVVYPYLDESQRMG